MNAAEIIDYMESLADMKQRQILMRFFKTGKEEYGEGDEFLGLRVPQTRRIAKEVKDLPLHEVQKLLYCKWHEVRLCGFLFLVSKFEKVSKKKLLYDAEAIEERDQIVNFYLEHAHQANNWDLVDLSAPKILGYWLLLPTLLGSTDRAVGLNTDYKLRILDQLADSKCLWLQRINIVCTWMTNRHGEPSYCLRYAERNLHHPHDLMHKAIGWMLREMGKNNGIELLRSFLEQHVHEMPRTMLRYAIEKLPETERQMWLRR
uniref:DNA alkylation repair protein n=1 Tax=Prevotella sp. GTC17260 TaxID=3236796 RepID=A0AB33J8D5_9BACT